MAHPQSTSTAYYSSVTGIVLSNIYAQLEMIINEHLINLQLLTNYQVPEGKDAEAGSCLINDTVNQFL